MQAPTLPTSAGFNPSQAFGEIVALCNLESQKNTDNKDLLGRPCLLWQHLFSEFLRDVCQRHIILAGVNFTICLTGLTTRALGTPYTAIEGFIIAENADDVEKIKTIDDIVEVDLKEIIPKKYHLDGETKIKMTMLCGTKEQIHKKIENSPNVEPYLNAIFGALPILGNNKRLYELQKMLKSSVIINDGISYYDIACFFYSLAIENFDSCFNNRDAIDFHRDILRPLMAIIDGLRFEFRCDELVIPDQIIRTLGLRGNISPQMETHLYKTIQRVMQLKWNLESNTNGKMDPLEIAGELKTLFHAVTILRAIMRNRVVKAGKEIKFNVARPKVIALNNFKADKKESNTIEISDPILASLKDTINSENFLQIQRTAFVEPQFKIHLSGIFNDLKYQEPLFSYISLLANAFNTTLDEHKFYHWLHMIVRRCTQEIFDQKGELKSNIKDLLNSEFQWYEKLVAQVNIQQAGKIILHSFVLSHVIYPLVSSEIYKQMSSGVPNNNLPKSSNVTIVKLLEKYFNELLVGGNIEKLQMTNYHDILTRIYAQLKSLEIYIKAAIQNRKKPLLADEKNTFEFFLGNEKTMNKLSNMVFKIHSLLGQTKQVTTEQFHECMDRLLPLLVTFTQTLARIRIEKQCKRSRAALVNSTFFTCKSRVDTVYQKLLTLEDLIMQGIPAAANEVKFTNSKP